MNKFNSQQYLKTFFISVQEQLKKLISFIQVKNEDENIQERKEILSYLNNILSVKVKNIDPDSLKEFLNLLKSKILFYDFVADRNYTEPLKCKQVLDFIDTKTLVYLALKGLNFSDLDLFEFKELRQLSIDFDLIESNLKIKELPKLEVLKITCDKLEQVSDILSNLNSKIKSIKIYCSNKDDISEKGKTSNKSNTSDDSSEDNESNYDSEISNTSNEDNYNNKTGNTSNENISKSIKQENKVKYFILPSCLIKLCLRNVSLDLVSFEDQTNNLMYLSLNGIKIKNFRFEINKLRIVNIKDCQIYSECLFRLLTLPNIERIILNNIIIKDFQENKIKNAFRLTNAKEIFLIPDLSEINSKLYSRIIKGLKYNHLKHLTLAIRKDDVKEFTELLKVLKVKFLEIILADIKDKKYYLIKRSKRLDSEEYEESSHIKKKTIEDIISSEPDLKEVIEPLLDSLNRNKKINKLIVYEHEHYKCNILRMNIKNIAKITRHKITKKNIKVFYILDIYEEVFCKCKPSFEKPVNSKEPIKNSKELKDDKKHKQDDKQINEELNKDLDKEFDSSDEESFETIHRDFIEVNSNDSETLDMKLFYSYCNSLKQTIFREIESFFQECSIKSHIETLNKNLESKVNRIMFYEPDFTIITKDGEIKTKKVIMNVRTGNDISSNMMVIEEELKYVRVFLEYLETGNLKIDFEDLKIERLLNIFDRYARRLVYPVFEDIKRLLLMFPFSIELFGNKSNFQSILFTSDYGFYKVNNFPVSRYMFYQDRKNMFNNKTSSDITVKISSSEKLKLHKFVLCENDYFKTMFTSGLKESRKKQIRLDKLAFDSELIKRFLMYLYSKDLSLFSGFEKDIKECSSFFLCNDLLI